VAVNATARCAFPFRFRGQSVFSSGEVGQPLAKGNCIEPGWPNRWMLRLLKIGVIPKGWSGTPGLAEETGVFGSSDLMNSKCEGVNPNAVRRFLIIASVVRTHGEPALGYRHRDRLYEFPGWKKSVV